MELVIERIRENLLEGVSTKVSRFGWQPSILRMSNVARVSHLLINSRFAAAWQKAIRKKGLVGALRGQLMAIRGFLASIILPLFRWRSSLESAKKTVQLTRKHISAWVDFLESDSDFLLVLEDDALLFEDFEPRWLGLQELLQEFGPAHKVFLCVGGGYELEELGASHLANERLSDSNAFSFSVPFTNTSVAYLANRALIKSFVELQMSSAGSGMLNADFLINDLLLKLNHQEKVGAMVCIHTIPAMFDNASLSGTYQSSL